MTNKELFHKLGNFGSPVVFILLISLIFIFLWVEIRPVITRRYCYRKVTKQMQENASGNKDWKRGKSWMANPILDNNEDWGWWYPIGSRKSILLQYDSCLFEIGVTPEPPLIKILREDL